MIASAKAGVDEKKRRQLRRFVSGEGSGSRMGVRDIGEETPLDRMIRQSGKIAE